MLVSIKLPLMTESMIDGVIEEWYKKVGDTVKSGEPLLKVDNGECVTNMRCPYNGVIKSIDVAVWDSALIGTALCIVETPDKIIRQFATPEVPVVLKTWNANKRK